jgi:hypothetical protein
MPRLLLTLGAILGATSLGFLASTPGEPGAKRGGPPAMRLDPTGGFFAWPYPLDARRSADGLDLNGFPNPRGEGFVDEAIALAADSAGFGLSGCVYLPFDGPLPAVADDPLASQRAGYPVLLVAIDPESPHHLRRHPIHVRATARRDGSRPAHLLQVLPLPGRSLAANTTYAAVVLRQLGGEGAPPLAQSPRLGQLLAGEVPEVEGGQALSVAYAPLRPVLDALKIDPAQVAAAAVFTTGDPVGVLARRVDRALAAAPPSLAEPLAPRDVHPGFVALRGAATMPVYQVGTPPFLAEGGEVVTDAEGRLISQGSAAAPFQLSIPLGRMPASGFPLYLYFHGTGGRESQAIDRGRRPARDQLPPVGSGLAGVVAPEGVATACMAGSFSRSRLGLRGGYLAYNFLHPVAMRDNFHQMLLEQVHFLNLLLSLRIDPALCPGADASTAADGRIRFDPERLVVGGQSLGSYLAGMFAALVPGFRGVVLTGAGGSWIEFPFGPEHPVPLTSLVELLALPYGERLDRFHPLVSLFAAATESADNMHVLRHLVREPLPGRTPPHVLVIEGHRDRQVATNLQRALVLAIGADLLGPDPGPTPEDQLLPALPWGGLEHLRGAVAGNRTLPSGERRTVVVVRYAEDGIRGGHHVAFQLERPKEQIVAFVRDAVSGRAPQVR